MWIWDFICWIAWWPYRRRFLKIISITQGIPIGQIEDSTYIEKINGVSLLLLEHFRIVMTIRKGMTVGQIWEHVSGRLSGRIL